MKLPELRRKAVEMVANISGDEDFVETLLTAKALMALTEITVVPDTQAGSSSPQA